MKETPLLARVDHLLTLGEQVLKTSRSNEHETDRVDNRILSHYRTAALSFLKQLFGDEHPYYEAFEKKEGNWAPTVDSTRGILEAVKDELTHGWHLSPRGIVSAEVFSDFLEMSEHLLSEGYKDAAAVMIGSTLEEHLRQLCRDNDIPVTVERDGKVKVVKADTLNADLAKAGAYNPVDQKNVTAWLAIRNNAAHGHYGEYSLEQVRLMVQAVTDFLARSSKK